MRRVRTRTWWLVVLALVGVLATAGGPAPVLAGAVLYTDDFESDTVGAVPVGWNVVTGTWATAVDGTQVMKETNTSTATAKSIWGGSPSWTDYGVQADVKIGTTAYGTSNVLAVRYQNDNNSYALILKDGNAWYLGKKVAGAWTTLKSGGFTYNTTTFYHLELDAAGNTLTAFINGNRVGTATDSTFTSGAIDFMSRYLIEIDNVTVSVVAPPPPPPPPSPSPSPNPSPSASPSGSPNPSPSANPSPTPSAPPSPSPTPSPTPPPAPSALSGTVTDSVLGTGISGATVSTQPSTTSTTTDPSGNYALNLPSGTYNVIFSASGYNADFAGGVVAPANGSASASMALNAVPIGVAMDQFSRPDQTGGLGTASDGNTWTNDFNVYPTAKAGITSRQAWIQTAKQFTDHDTWMGIPYRDMEVTVDMNMVVVVQDPSFQHGGRVLARVMGYDSWVVMALNPSNSTLTLWVDAAGNWTQIGGVTLSFLTNATYHAKLDVIDTKVYGKAWLVGSAEPGWQVTATQTSLSSAGVGGLRVGAADVYFTNYTQVPITQISGKVTKATTGTALAGVTVTLSNGATAVTDSGGSYTFAGLSPGTYTVSASPAGYIPGSNSATVTTGLSATGVNLALTPVGSPSPSPTPGGGPGPTPTPGG